MTRNAPHAGPSREYLVLDPKRVQARVNGFGVNANIPGIEVWMESQASVRRRF